MFWSKDTVIPPWSMAICAMLAVQLANALSVTAIEHIGSAGTAWLRMCFGTIFLFLIAKPKIHRLKSADILPLLVLGVVTGFMTTFFLAAAERIPLGTAVAIEFLGPLTVAALTSRNRKLLIWPVLALVGVMLLTEPWHAAIDFVGVAFALAAGACWALYNVFTQIVGDRFAGISGLALTIPVAALAIMPFGLPEVISGNKNLWVFLLAAVIALITPVIAFGLEMLALRKMTHTAFGTLLSIEPAFGVLIGLIVLAQKPTIMQIIGILLVIFAGAAAQRNGKRDAVTPTATTLAQQEILKP